MKDILYILIISAFALSCSSQKNYHQEIQNDHLDSVIALINLEFKSDEEFLKKLAISQRNWEQSILSDLDLIYPKANKEEYGSSYLSCVKRILNWEIKNRVALLEKWTNGISEGELCNGSIPINKFEVPATGNIKNEKLNHILKADTIVFDHKYSLQDFVNFIEIKKGKLELKGLPSGKVVHYNPITSNEFENDINEVPSGVYIMDLRYDFDLKPYKRIYKPIRINRKKVSK